MKRLLYIAVLAGVCLFSNSCSDMLNIESKTDITTSYIFNSKHGLESAVVALYYQDRFMASENNNYEFIIPMLDYSTDLMIFRGGTAAGAARLDTQSPSDAWFLRYWTNNYAVIGKANEIVAAAEKLGLDDPDVKYAYAEAKCLRGRAYFLLWQKFERLYLNTEPTTLDNAFGREFRAASNEQILTQIKADLDAAIETLDWTCRNEEYGRMTKAVAKHIRAQVAMWEKDYDTAIRQCEDIFSNSNYGLLPKIEEVFAGADLRHKEVLYAYQFSENPGGGGMITDGVFYGHYVGRDTTPNYSKLSGLSDCMEYGAHGAGRIYPNSYLLSLYDQAKDKRYTEWFRHKLYYNDPAQVPEGKKLGDEVVAPTANYLECAHPSSLKYFDKWTRVDRPTMVTSFKDLIVYRLAETYLMCAEAYFHRDGASSAKAIEYFNKTWERAGNDHFNGPLTLDILIDEYARELHFEGVRWPLLKRLGILGDRVRAHSGDTKADDPKLNKDFTEARRNFKDNRDVRWPIPQSILDLMPGYGQNEGWY